MASRTRSRSPPAMQQYWVFVGQRGRFFENMFFNGLFGHQQRRIFGREIGWRSANPGRDAWVEIPGIGKFTDTPGLANNWEPGLQKQAAKAITEAFKKDGYYRVFFVLTLESGRIRPADVTTMKLVLDCVPITRYGVIINKVTRRVEHALKDALKDPDKFKEFIAPMTDRLPLVVGLESFHISTQNEILELEDVIDQYKLHQDTREFLLKLPGMAIVSHEVKDVQADEFEEMQAIFEKTIAR